MTVHRPTDPYLSERGKLAYANRPGSSTEERIAARCRWTVIYLERQIRESLAAAPTLSAEQRLDLALLLTGDS